MVSKQADSRVGKPCAALEEFVALTAPMLELEKNEEIMRVIGSTHLFLYNRHGNFCSRVLQWLASSCHLKAISAGGKEVTGTVEGATGLDFSYWIHGYMFR